MTCGWTSVLAFAAVLVPWLAPLSVLADDTPWGEAKPLIDTRMHDEVAFAADRYGQVHVLWASKKPKDAKGSVLFYARWGGREWLVPRQVIAQPSDVIRFPVLASSNDGQLYACWYGTNAFTYFSRADVLEADRAEAWSPIAAISRVAALHCDVKVDAAGTIDVLYAASGGDVLHTRSDDQGRSWSAPVKVSAVSSRIGTDYPRLAIDDAGGLHAVWTEYALPNGEPVLGTAYTRSLDGGVSWAPPLAITTGSEYAEINVLANGTDEIHLAWNGRIGFGGRYHQQSQDRGLTWSGIEEVIPKDAPGGGRTGPPDMAADSSGVVHLVSGMNPGGVMVSSRGGNGWDQPQLLQSPAGWSEKARIVVSEGNRLHVISQGWYFTRTINAPRLEPAPIPVAMPAAGLLSNPIVGVLLSSVALLSLVFVVRSWRIRGGSQRHR